MARALAERDLESLDRAVAQAAARREEADRQRAREALREAARRAREEGDDGLAESLLRRESLLQERSEQAALARELAEAMPELAGEGWSASSNGWTAARAMGPSSAGRWSTRCARPGRA